MIMTKCMYFTSTCKWDCRRTGTEISVASDLKFFERIHYIFVCIIWRHLCLKPPSSGQRFTSRLSVVFADSHVADRGIGCIRGLQVLVHIDHRQCCWDCELHNNDTGWCWGGQTGRLITPSSMTTTSPRGLLLFTQESAQCQLSELLFCNRN